MSQRPPALSALRAPALEVRDDNPQANPNWRGDRLRIDRAVQILRTNDDVLIVFRDLARNGSTAAARSGCRSAPRWTTVMDQPRAAQLDTAGHAAADRAQPRAGHPADDD